MSKEGGEEEGEDELVFVGTGVSTALPVLGHLDGRCSVCMEALTVDTSPNRRNNVSLLLRVAATRQNILIDCGKTFRAAFLRTLAPLHVSRIHSLLLTHDHADAIDGLDDLRDLQTFNDTPDYRCRYVCVCVCQCVREIFFYFIPLFPFTPSLFLSLGPPSFPLLPTFSIHLSSAFRCTWPIPTYLSATTFGTLEKRISYIVEASRKVMADRDVLLPRRVTCLDFNVLPSDEEVCTFVPPGSEHFGGKLSFPLSSLSFLLIFFPLSIDRVQVVACHSWSGLQLPRFLLRPKNKNRLHFRRHGSERVCDGVPPLRHADRCPHHRLPTR